MAFRVYNDAECFFAVWQPPEYVRIRISFSGNFIENGTLQKTHRLAARECSAPIVSSAFSKPSRAATSAHHDMTELISFNEAQQRFIQTFESAGSPVRVPLGDAMGRVLATPIHATFDQPPANQSAMDGYAIRYADAAPGVALPIQQRCYAGDEPFPLEPGCATRIFTGSMIPSGADTVVIQEDARETGECVMFETPVRLGTHIRRRGEELRMGETLVNAGTRLQAAHIGLIASQGIATLDVHPMLKVGILTTGDELAPIGGSRGATQIYNSNGPMLAALVAGLGASVTRVVHAKDNEGALTQLLSELHDACDLILTTGGASVGERDLVRPALTSLGVSFVVSGVSMKPGKPISLARYGTTPVVLLPGNPGAVFTTFALLATPLIRRLQWRAECLPPVTRLPIDFDARPDEARERFLRVRLDTSSGQGSVLRVAAEQGAGNLLTLADASGLSQLARGQSIARHATVPYYDFAQWLV